MTDIPKSDQNNLPATIPTENNVVNTEFALEIVKSKAETQNEKSEPPKFIYEALLYFYAVGLGYAMVAPYNAMVTVMYYFKLVYEPHGYTPEFTFPVVSYVPLVLVQIVLLAYDQKVPVFIKLVFSTFMMAISSFAMPFIAEFVSNPSASFGLQIFMLVIQNWFLAFLEPAGFSILGSIDPTGKYINGVMVGISIGGVITAALQFFCIGVFGPDSRPFNSVILLFSIVFALMLASVVISFLLIRHPTVAEGIKKMPENKPIKEIWTTGIKILFDQGINVAIVYAVSYGVFPGVIIAQPIKSVASQWSIPIIVFLFNTFDTIGKAVSNYFRIVSREHLIWPCLARVIIALFICFIGYSLFNEVFVADWLIIVLISLLGFTNGLLSTYAMMYGGDLTEDKNLAGGLMVFYLTIGLLIGSILSQALFANLF